MWVWPLRLTPPDELPNVQKLDKEEIAKLHLLETGHYLRSLDELDRAIPAQISRRRTPIQERFSGVVGGMELKVEK